jgi:carboxypeptidase C (cathepsin A)
MSLLRRVLVSLLCGLLLSAGAGWADDSVKEDGAQQAEPGGEVVERCVETQHKVTIDGRKVAYTAIAGNLALTQDVEDPKASIFYIAYIRSDAKDPARRPITFSFNGGPGSSSVWLHLGLLGPRRVRMDAMGRPAPPPHALVDNPYSLLDETDLVFIDPVSTGFSRAAEGEDAQQFHGLDEDIRWVGEFIRLYTTRNQRWESPKFLIGESYGTTRAAGLCGYLQERHGMYLNGVMLISSILDFATARFTAGNDLPYILFLPSYTASAWYHERLAPDLQRDLQTALRQAERFANGVYAGALLQGDALSAAERGSVAEELARLTGLSRDYVEQVNLRPSIYRFTKELLRDQRRTVGRLDSRFVGIDADAAGEYGGYDPSYAAIVGAFSAMMNHYVRSELEYESDAPYEILTDKVYPWSYDAYENRYVNVAETLRGAITKNPALRVFVASGYYDLATPYAATDYTFRHLGLDPGLRDRVSMRYYEAGHMIYIHQDSLRRLRGDLVEFLRGATGGAE